MGSSWPSSRLIVVFSNRSAETRLAEPRKIEPFSRVRISCAPGGGLPVEAEKAYQASLSIPTLLSPTTPNVRTSPPRSDVLSYNTSSAVLADGARLVLRIGGTGASVHRICLLRDLRQLREDDLLKRPRPTHWRSTSK